MDITRIKLLAGCKDTLLEQEIRDNVMLNEASVIADDSSMEQLMFMFDAARRGMGLINRLKNPVDRTKHLRAVFTNLNKIRGAISRLIKQEEQQIETPM